jgi:hypothetical protein
VKAARQEEGSVAEPQDLGEEDQEQQRAQQRRDADVCGGGWPSAVLARPTGAERDAVEQ